MIVLVDQGERLEVFSAIGASKKVAKEEAAKLMALSGHCVSSLFASDGFPEVSDNPSEAYATSTCALAPT